MSVVVAPTQASIYETMEIFPLEEGGEPIELKGGVVEFQYFENLFSPYLTANLTIVNDGYGDTANLYNELPIRGGEKVKLHVTTPWEQADEEVPGKLELTMYVNSISNYIQQKSFESYTLQLVSKEAILNLRKRVTKKYKGKRIDEIIKVFLDLVEIEDDGIDGELEETTNTYNFIGNLRKPFTLAPMLAARGIPKGGNSSDAGFLLWQTRKGMRFRSLKSIITKTEEHYEHGYYFNQENVGDEAAVWTKIITYVVDKSNNVTGASRVGEYSSYRIYFNPHSLEFTQPNESRFTSKTEGGDDTQEQLGKTSSQITELADPNNITEPEFAQRIVSGVLNVGCLDKEVNKDVNMDQMQDISQSISRYSSIFNQSILLTVPVNVELCAGDVINCNFPKSKTGKGEQDTEQSGLYIIKELTHYFTPNKSYTALKIIRDTSGV